MFESSHYAQSVKQKVRTRVEVTLTDGSLMTGEMFVHADQRMLDILNDDRRFVPVESVEGAISCINKSVIAKVSPVAAAVNADEKVVAFGG